MKQSASKQIRQINRKLERIGKKVDEHLFDAKYMLIKPWINLFKRKDRYQLHNYPATDY